MPPVTVLFDSGLLPSPDARASSVHTRGRGEWAVECCASVATSLVGAGHAGRVVATASTVALSPHAPGGRGEGVATMLDQCVDLRGLHDAGEAERALVATADVLRGQRHPDEITFAVLAPASAASRTALAALAGEGYHGAIVVLGHHATPGDRRDARDTVSTLRAAGWRAVEVDDGTPLEHVWIHLVEDAS